MRYACVLTAVVLLAAGAAAEEWPAWRGPRGDGTSAETGVPLRWSGTENVAWKTLIPGKSHSSPVVWGDRVFVTTCLEGQRQRMLFCLDRRSGAIRWHRVVLTAPLEKINELNSYASSTPATDGRHVWVTFLDRPHIRVVCYTVEGEEVWRVSPGEFHACHGYCSSLIPYKDTIILNADQDAELPLRAYIVAFDGATGKERWRIDRPNRIRSYCPPAIFRAAGKMQMVLSGCQCVASYDPDTGKPHWIIDGPTEQFCASLVYTDGLFLMTGGWPAKHILGIRPDGTGNVQRHPHARGVAPDGGQDHLVRPVAHCRRQVLLRGQRRRHRHVPGGQDGPKDVVRAARKASQREPRLGRGPPLLPRRRRHGEACRASPAISRGQMILRARHHVYCIGACE